MVKSMFAAVAGLRTHQSKMDVIGNNIANVNTWGYKAGSMSFKDTMYQNTSSGSGGSTDTGSYGGTNANQVGYGVTTGSISYDFSSGSPSPSARGLDCMIDGTGFFIVGPMVSGGSVSLDSDDAIKTSGLYLSRVGKFDVDSHGYLVDDSGNYVYGFVNSSGDWTSSETFDTTSLQPLKIPTTAEMTDVNNKKASDKVAAALKAYNEAIAAQTTAQGTLATAQQNYIETKNAYDKAMSDNNVDSLKTDYDTAAALAKEAYTKWVTNTNPSDELALRNDYSAKLLDADNKQFAYIKAKANLCAPTALDKNTSPVDILTDTLTNYQSKFNAFWSANPLPDSTDARTTELETAQKALIDLENTLSQTETGSKEDKLQSMKLAVDKASTAVTAATKKVTEAKNTLETAQKSATTTATGNTDSDDTVAKLTNYKIQKDGTVVGTSEGGDTIIIGKIALAGVQNTSGLEKTSGYYYSIGANAGNVSAYEGGGTQGKILGNYLEMAKVDLATEMTDMITTQRGFQANSKIITVTDQMLEELVNMKR